MNRALSFLRKFLSVMARHKYVWTIGLFVLIVGFIDDNSYYNYFLLKKDNAELDKEIKKYEDKFNHDYAMLRQLKTDPRALIKVAREDHQMKSADEDVYYIVHSDSLNTK